MDNQNTSAMTHRRRQHSSPEPSAYDLEGNPKEELNDVTAFESVQSTDDDTLVLQNTPINSNLTRCPDCGKEISKRAVSCPFCGCPINEPPSKKSDKTQHTNDNENKKEKSSGCSGCITLVVVIVIVVFFLGFLGSMGGSTTSARSTGSNKCYYCNGTGRVMNGRVAKDSVDYALNSVPCPKCHGTGVR